MMLFPKQQSNLEQYFEDQGLGLIVKESRGIEPSVNDKLSLETPYKPNLSDLYRLHRFVIENKRTTVMEFGVGWSTLVLAHAMSLNKVKYSKNMANLRRNNPFEVHSVDSEQEFMKVAEKRLPNNLKPFVTFTHSPIKMTTFQGRYATEYHHLPLVNPDFIYLDGPDQFNLSNDINGFSTAHKDMMPMACDILKFEHYLTPGTIIVVDGRAANTRFLKANMQRNWDYSYAAEVDQHIFLLNEDPLGKYNRQQLEFYHEKI